MRSPSRFRRLAHLGLLVAALLQFAGAAIGPWAHGYGRSGSSGDTICAPERHDRHAPVSHNELGCWLWQALAAVAPPPADAPVPLPAGEPSLAPPGNDRALSSLALARPRARAPPVS